MAIARKQRTVDTSALPGARRTAAETAVSSGAAVASARAETFETVANIGRGVAAQGVRIYGRQQAEQRREAAEAKSRADDVAVLAGDNRLATWMREKVYHPETGALAQQGPAAFELPEKLEQEFETLAGDIERSLGNDEQRFAFSRIRSNRAEAMSHTVRSHVAREMQTYAASELKANTENSIDLVVANANNPRIAAQELAGAESYIRKVGPQLGMGPEAIDENIGILRTRAVGGVITRLIDQGNMAAARAYYEEWGSQLNGEQQGDIEKALKVGDVKKQSQTKADEIITAGGTVDEWRTKAKQITDPDVREETLRLVEHEQAFVERRKREADDMRMRNAAAIVERTKGVNAIPSTEWAQMDLAQRNALRAYGDELARGRQIETDFGTLYRLYQMAGDDPDAFVAENLTNYISKVGKQDLEQLGQMQLAMKQANVKSAAVILDGFMSNQQIVNDALLQAGLDPSPAPGTPEVEPVIRLRREVDRRVQALQASTQKKATNADVQEIVDELMLSVTTEKGTWLGAITSGPFADVQKRLMDITIADIPATDRAQLEDALRALGVPITEQSVVSLYRRHKFIESRNKR